MTDNKDYLKKAFDESQPTGTRYSAICQVQTEVLFKLKKLQDMAWRLDETKKILQQKALSEFKETLQVKFMEKYSKEVQAGSYTNPMMKDFSKIEAMETHGCYHFQGITVIKEDCNLCRRKCQVKGD